MYVRMYVSMYVCKYVCVCVYVCVYVRMYAVYVYSIIGTQKSDPVHRRLPYCEVKSKQKTKVGQVYYYQLNVR
jgi:hypothetical protein